MATRYKLKGMFKLENILNFEHSTMAKNILYYANEIFGTKTA